MNFRFDPLLPDRYSLSPDCSTNFPASKLTVSLNGTGKVLQISVLTAPLLCTRVTSYDTVALMFATWASSTTATYPIGAVYTRVDEVETTWVTVLNELVFNDIGSYAPRARMNGVTAENRLLEYAVPEISPKA